jgi:hypothetical protein
LNFFIFNPLPIPRPSRHDPLWRRVVLCAGRLAASNRHFKEWAGAVGVEHGPIGEQEREDLIYELDAAVAHLYGLTEPHLAHIYGTFHEDWNYAARFQATLKRYREIAAKKL